MILKICFELASSVN